MRTLVEHLHCRAKKSGLGVEADETALGELMAGQSELDGGAMELNSGREGKEERGGLDGERERVAVPSRAGTAHLGVE